MSTFWRLACKYEMNDSAVVLTLESLLRDMIRRPDPSFSLNHADIFVSSYCQGSNEKLNGSSVFMSVNTVVFHASLFEMTRENCWHLVKLSRVMRLKMF